MTDPDDTDIPEQFDPARAEARWRERWQESGVYEYDGDPERPDYVVDTPPPYPTGNFHIGNALGWCYMDFVARYRRLQGDDVLFPQGWDCHGLPTEVKVEEDRDVHRTEVPREQFREWCIEHTEEQIDAMRETMLDLGFSQDWSHEFRTMDAEYWGETQRSFVRMAGDGERPDGSRASSDESDGGYVYRDEHPVNWCPRCETAIADAEVETTQRRGTLYYVEFAGADADTEAIEIATTRPELLAACVAVAVHPDDERYAGREGDAVEVPVTGQTVEVLTDADVDPEFGSGAVMVCTFGDKQDVDWWLAHDLDLRPAFTEDGHLTDLAGEFAGLAIDEAHERLATALETAGHLHREEPTEQSVGVCWRCETPIEILSREQWFVEVRQDEILDIAREVEWVPEHMYERLAEWTEGMDWDWVVSRQRVFATPIPAWFCEGCGHTHVASEDEVPVDPTEDDPAVGACPECGGTEWRGETDVMDTWMDSSISPLYVTGWPETAFEPVQLREQGHDIIRTWAFYTLLRVAALEDEPPWETALVNGMVFGEDGHKMSKSRGNYVQPGAVVDEHGADAFRQAMALAGQPGQDVQFQWKDVTTAARFTRKLWNIAKFTTRHADERTPGVQDPAYRDADEWILGRCAEVVASVEADVEAHRFDAALRELREFVWHDLADDYLELVKGRLYEGRPGERNAARHALYTALTASLRMLAPFAPFVTEEAWSHLPTEGSVHESTWPDLPEQDEATVRRGQRVADVAAVVRGWKGDEGIALNEELDRIEVYVDADRDHEGPYLDTYDLASAVNAPVYVEEGSPAVELVPVALDPDHSAIGPAFREQAGAVLDALEAMDPAEARAQLDTAGEVEVDLGDRVVAVDGDAVDVREEYRAESGEEVAVLGAGDTTVIVYPPDDGDDEGGELDEGDGSDGTDGETASGAADGEDTSGAADDDDVPGAVDDDVPGAVDDDVPGAVDDDVPGAVDDDVSEAADGDDVSGAVDDGNGPGA